MRTAPFHFAHSRCTIGASAREGEGEDHGEGQPAEGGRHLCHPIDFIGAALVAGIGVLLFSLAILRTTVAPKWVAWLGFLVALLGGWFTFLRPVGEVFEFIEFIGSLGFWVWMVALGVALWRAPEPASAKINQSTPIEVRGGVEQGE